jgi:hypothetical protein
LLSTNRQRITTRLPAAVSFHTMEVFMIDYTAIAVHMRAAQLYPTASMGEMIADAIVATWSQLKTAGRYLRCQGKLMMTMPDSYSTSLYRKERHQQV